MGKSQTEFDIDFADPLVDGDAARIRAFHARLTDRPGVAEPDLVSDPSFLFVAEEFLRRSPRKPVVALVERAGAPVAIIPMEYGPEKNLPGEYVSLFRHPTRLSGACLTCAPPDLPAALSATIDALCRQRPKAVGFSLVGLEIDSDLHAAASGIFAYNPTLGREEKILYHIELAPDATPDDFYDGQPRNYKKHFRLGRNRLDKAGGYTYTEDGPDGPWTFADMARIDAMTWRADEKEGDKPKLLLRMCERLAQAHPPEQSHLGALVFEGKPIAMYYAIRSGPVSYVLKNTFDPDYSHYSPGIVAYHHAIEHGIRAGAHRFELMSGNQYAHSLANRERRLSDDVVFFRNARGRSAHLAVTASRKMRDIASMASDKLAKGSPAKP